MEALLVLVFVSRQNEFLCKDFLFPKYQLTEQAVMLIRQVSYECECKNRPNLEESL